MKKLYFAGFIVVAIIMVLSSSLYVLDQREYALVLQFGDVVSEEKEPGLKIKIPLIQNVVFFDNRIQHLTFSPGESSEVMALDQKTMKLDAFAKYRIVDPLKFYQSTQNEQRFKMRIGAIMESSIREVIGTFLFIDVLGTHRNDITKKVTELVNSHAINFGVEIIDVRIVRVNLPDKAKNAVYERMRTERQKEAAEIRAQGAEEAQVIKAGADRDRTVILAEANKSAEILKGQGEAEAIRIFSNSFGQDPEFFGFSRSLEAYKNAFLDANTKFILSSDSEFAKYFTQ